MGDIRYTGLPSRAALDEKGLFLELREIPPQELQDAFMQETVKRLPANKAILEIPTAAIGEMPDGAAPAGIIFHVARCGSTLGSQLLKLDDRIVVYSEPLPFNELLVPPQKGDRARIVAALRTLGACFARHARRPYVLKLTSWNTLYCDLVVEAFPTTPWSLFVRDPLEVCVSLQQHRPGWLRDPRLFEHEIDPARAARTADDTLALMFAAFCRVAERLDPARGLLVAYETLPAAIWERLAPHLGLAVEEGLRARMQGASTAYSKAPFGKPVEFVRDDTRKRADASQQLRRSVETFARPALERLAARFPDTRS